MSIFPFATIFVLTIVTIFCLRPFAIKFELLDFPNDRKKHTGSVPLIGGIAMFFCVSFGLLISNTVILYDNLFFLILSSFILVILGAIDDYKNISHKIRLFFQVISALIIIEFGGVLVENLGGLFSVDSIHLGVFSLIFTIFAIVGVINALNFSDGVDGVSASLSIVTFSSVAFFAFIFNDIFALKFVFCFIVSIFAFLIFNVGLGQNSKFKVFMGDAGSTFLGLGIAWCLITFSQGNMQIFKPVTALWIYAIPIIDASSVMIRRISNGESPFAPDRKHLHHFFILSGYSDRKALSFIVIMSIMTSSIGISMEINNFPDSIMFLFFLIISFIYFFTLRHAWKALNV